MSESRSRSLGWLWLVVAAFLISVIAIAGSLVALSYWDCRKRMMESFASSAFRLRVSHLGMKNGAPSITWRVRVWLEKDGTWFAAGVLDGPHHHSETSNDRAHDVMLSHAACEPDPLRACSTGYPVRIRT
ncbi:MAG: hypothetical protein H0W72_02185 [Planctomycetes bacterium]|nr:hypothetical protein [Planctomycetota bacterium]